jgi:multiple sugar transport system permease protein
MVKNKKKFFGKLWYHVFVTMMGFFMIYPVVWLLASSFKDNSEIFVNAQSLIPKHFKISNYITGWEGFGGISFAIFFKNSLIITLSCTILVVLSSSIVAYGFSRVKFKGKRFWFACMVMTMMLPGQVTIIPQYIMFNKLNWINTFNPFVVPSLFADAFFTFLIMQFIRGIPIELDESAKIDGCGKLSIFVRIIFPLIKPALIAAAIFSFYWRWDDFMGPLIYLNKPRLYTVSFALNMFADPYSITNWGAMFAMSVLSLIPATIIFVKFQKYLVEGISTTGLKS